MRQAWRGVAPPNRFGATPPDRALQAFLAVPACGSCVRSGDAELELALNSDAAPRAPVRTVPTAVAPYRADQRRNARAGNQCAVAGLFGSRIAAPDLRPAQDLK